MMIIIIFSPLDNLFDTAKTKVGYIQLLSLSLSFPRVVSIYKHTNTHKSI